MAAGFQRGGIWRPVPVTLKGHASFNGTATGKLSEIIIAGNLQSQDFETLIPATSQTAEKMLRWDALRADIQLSPSVFAVRNGTLSRNPDSLKFDFHVHLFSGSSPTPARFRRTLIPRTPIWPEFLPCGVRISGDGNCGRSAAGGRHASRSRRARAYSAAQWHGLWRTG